MERVRATGRFRTRLDDAGSHRTQYHSQHRALPIDPGVRPAVLLAGGPAGVAALAGRARSSGRGRTGILKPVAFQAGYSDGESFRSLATTIVPNSRASGSRPGLWPAPRVRALRGVQIFGLRQRSRLRTRG